MVRGLTDLLLDWSHCDLLLNRGEALMVGGAHFSLMNSSQSVLWEFSISASTSFSSSSSTGSNVMLSGLSSKGIHFLNKMSTTGPATKTSPPELLSHLCSSTPKHCSIIKHQFNGFLRSAQQSVTVVLLLKYVCSLRR